MRALAITMALAMGCTRVPLTVRASACSTETTRRLVAPIQFAYDFLIVADDTPDAHARVQALAATVADVGTQIGPGSYRFGVVARKEPGAATMHAVGAAAAASCAPLRDGATFAFQDQLFGLDDLPAGEDLPRALDCMVSVGASGDLDPALTASFALEINPTFHRPQADVVRVFATTDYSSDVDTLRRDLFAVASDFLLTTCTDSLPGLDCVAVDEVNGVPTRQLPACAVDSSRDCWRIVDAAACKSGRRLDVQRAQEPTLGTETRFYCDGEC